MEADVQEASMATKWLVVGVKDKQQGKEMRLPTERGLSTGEKLLGMLIPGVNILVATEMLSQQPNASDDAEYVRGYLGASKT